MFYGEMIDIFLGYIWDIFFYYISLRDEEAINPNRANYGVGAGLGEIARKVRGGDPNMRRPERAKAEWSGAGGAGRVHMCGRFLRGERHVDSFTLNFVYLWREVELLFTVLLD